jgi:hypothetical protein
LGNGERRSGIPQALAGDRNITVKLVDTMEFPEINLEAGRAGAFRVEAGRPAA